MAARPARAGFVLLLGATRDTDAANALTVLHDWQPATKGHKAGPEHKAFAHGGGMLLQGCLPLAGRQAEAGCRVGLVDGDVHRMQRRTRHAQERRQHTAGIHHRHIDAHAPVLGRLHRRTNSQVRGGPVDGLQGDADGQPGSRGP